MTTVNLIIDRLEDLEYEIRRLMFSDCYSFYPSGNGNIDQLHGALKADLKKNSFLISLLVFVGKNLGVSFPEKGQETEIVLWIRGLLQARSMFLS